MANGIHVTVEVSYSVRLTADLEEVRQGKETLFVEAQDDNSAGLLACEAVRAAYPRYRTVQWTNCRRGRVANPEAAATGRGPTYGVWFMD